MEDKESGPGAESVVSTRTVEAVVAAIIFVFAAIFLFNSYKLGFRWGSDGPQSGYFPFYVSLIICVSSAAIFFQALFTDDIKGAMPFVERTQLKQVMSVLLPMAAYVVGIQLVGIYAASIAYVALFMRWLGKYSWVKSILLALTISVMFFLMFEVWFRVPLFKGYWNLTGWMGY